MRPALRVFVALPAMALAACQHKPDIPMAPYGADYRTKPDFARVEHAFPLTRTHLMRLTPENVATLQQEEIDQVYARLTAGPIPDGAYEGTFFLAEGGGLRRLPEVLGDLLGAAADARLDLLQGVGGRLWQGKVFHRDQRELRGYCGQSLLDGRRESIVSDYAFGSSQIRDEIRMVRPGFYLGRSYLSRVFALNFTLLNEKVAKEQGDAFMKTGRIEEDCWPGHQRLSTSK